MNTDPRRALPAADPSDSTRPIANIEESIDTFQVFAERPFCHPESTGDRTICPSLGKLEGNLELPGRQPECLKTLGARINIVLQDHDVWCDGARHMPTGDSVGRLRDPDRTG